MLTATELRIWGAREARGGNGLVTFCQTVARRVTRAHSAVLLVWLATLGARRAGEILGAPGGVLDAVVERIASELRYEDRRDVSVASDVGFPDPIRG
jgi:hypothetical protein